MITAILSRMRYVFAVLLLSCSTPGNRAGILLQWHIYHLYCVWLDGYDNCVPLSYRMKNKSIEGKLTNWIRLPHHHRGILLPLESCKKTKLRNRLCFLKTDQHKVILSLGKVIFFICLRCRIDVVELLSVTKDDVYLFLLSSFRMSDGEP